MLTQRRFKKGEIIIRENDTGDAAYIIERGRVEVTKQANGKNVHIRYLKPEDIFGEMSMIDDKPRSATITAVEDTVVKEIHRNEFLDVLKNDHDVAVLILKTLFNRLRETNVKVLQLQRRNQGPLETSETTAGKGPSNARIQVTLKGLTPHASGALPEEPFRISKFPFMLGRKSRDPFSHNDLNIPDAVPYQISRYHVKIIRQNNLVGVIDRGSTLGTEVDGKRFGGDDPNPGPVFFDGSEGTLVIGTDDSPFRYKVVIGSE